MDNHSINTRKRILNSYLRKSKQTLRIPKTPDHPCNQLSYLELHNIDRDVWFVGNNFYIINNGIKLHIPEGYCVCFRYELNSISRIIFKGKYHRCVMCLVWFRDVMNYNVNEIHSIMDSTLKCEGFGKVARCFLLLALRLK